MLRDVKGGLRVAFGQISQLAAVRQPLQGIGEQGQPGRGGALVKQDIEGNGLHGGGEDANLAAQVVAQQVGLEAG